MTAEPTKPSKTERGKVKEASPISTPAPRRRGYRDCVHNLLDADAEYFPGSYTWRKARSMICIDLRSNGASPDEVKQILTPWVRRTRKCSPREEKNLANDFVDWLFDKDSIAQVSCARTGAMAEMGWCVRGTCQYREERRQELNAQRARPFDLSKWRQWQRHLIKEYRNGVYIAATYEALRDRWLGLGLVDGQPVFIGCRELGAEAAQLVDRRRPRKPTRTHGMSALRATHKLEEEGLIRKVSTGESGRGAYRKANGYVLLPMPDAPGCTSS